MSDAAAITAAVRAASNDRSTIRAFPTPGMGEMVPGAPAFAPVIDVQAAPFSPSSAKSRREIEALKATMVPRAQLTYVQNLKWLLIGALEKATGKRIDAATGFPMGNNGGKYVTGAIVFADGSTL